MNVSAVVGLIACGFVLLIMIVAATMPDDPHPLTYKELNRDLMKRRNRGCYNCKHYNDKYCVQEIEIKEWDYVRGVENVKVNRRSMNCYSTIGSDLCNWEKKC